MAISKSITKGLYTLSLHDNGIMYVHISDESQETIETQTEIIKLAGEFLNGKAHPTIHTHGTFAQPSEEVRANYAKKETNPYSSADAFVGDSLAWRILANFYLSHNKPSRPTKFFKTEEEAIEWLKQF